MSRELIKGIFLLLVGALMLGGSGIFVKISESSPSLIAFYRSLFALPFLYVWMKFEERKKSPDITWDKKTFFFLLLGGYVLPWICQFGIGLCPLPQLPMQL